MRKMFNFILCLKRNKNIILYFPKNVDAVLVNCMIISLTSLKHFIPKTL